MKKKYILLLLLAPFAGIAQIDSTKAEGSAKKKNEFSASINYQSNLHYFGRVDSFKSSGLFPIIGYQLKNGLYGQGTAVFVQNPSTPFSYTGASVELGYRFPEKKHFEGNVYVSKFLYSDQSVLVQSALQGQTGVNITYKNKIVNVTGGADLKLSDQIDIGATAGINHLFVKKITGWKKSAIAVMPMATLNAGTQNFTNTYIDKTNVLGVPVTRQRTEKIEQFNILSYEFAAPIVLVAGKFNTYVIPSYVMPQNLISGLENGKDLFYIIIGLGVRL